MLESKNPASKSPVDDFSKAQKQEWINYLIEKVGCVNNATIVGCSYGEYLEAITAYLVETKG